MTIHALRCPGFPRIPPRCPTWSLRSSPHPCRCFIAVTTHAKHDPIAQFVLSPRLFSCLPVSLHPNASMQTPCTPIRGHPCTFCLFLAKHDVRGNFPGHRATNMSCTTGFVSVCLVFVSPHAPCVQTHPCTPIRTHLNLFSPVYTRLHIYVCII